MGQEQMANPGTKSLELALTQEDKTICNISETPNNYCPKTPERLAEELREARRGLFSGTTLAVIFAVGMGLTFFLRYQFIRYFEYKEKWHIERARLKTIRKVNRTMAKRGLDNHYPENTDQWLLDHPPSRFWAFVFENEVFIALLDFVEHRTASVGKFTGMMGRPKLGDEASGIPLNSLRARRRYRGRRRGSLQATSREAPKSLFPPPISTQHHHEEPSRGGSVASSHGLPIGFNSIDTASDDEFQGPDRESYQIPGGFGGTPWAPEDDASS
ncbi:hypothetical protein TWF730_005914 [Orbilia blumenaviensis]|uniref:Uncharacterized protein n=1 Tax=Orbilia blumenaviensis TaxID=1796055 RepID=A0AAV9VLW1_9PEZI